MKILYNPGSTKERIAIIFSSSEQELAFSVIDSIADHLEENGEKARAFDLRKSLASLDKIEDPSICFCQKQEDFACDVLISLAEYFKGEKETDAANYILSRVQIIKQRSVGQVATNSWKENPKFVSVGSSLIS